MEIETFTKSQPGFFGDKILECSGGKKQSEAGRSDFDVCFAYKPKETQHCCSLSPLLKSKLGMSLLL